ncbi:hypothetical protein IFM89_009471 [Coptis chinensis]|uniref:Uncharacterized protein n=1 Tax=Coptis chinensis TaxID=261450 RepID=A0A835LZT4_9MAGN|nr:hypothetical protein IFM89_009471 [Coptis chinensis]
MTQVFAGHLTTLELDVVSTENMVIVWIAFGIMTRKGDHSPCHQLIDKAWVPTPSHWCPDVHQQHQQLEEEKVALGMSSELHPIARTLQVVNGGGMEDWESVLSKSDASLIQEQSFLGWAMGEVEDLSSSLKHLLQNGGGGLDF